MSRFNTKDFVILFSIVSVGLFLRLYKLPSMVGFDFDQEYAAMFAQTILKVFPIQMIGQGLSVQGLFMGPFYFYYLVPFFALTGLDPIGGYIGSIVLGTGTIILYYVLLRRVFGRVAGIIGALLASTLLLYIQYDWAMAPAYSSTFIILITWFCLYKYWHGNTAYLLLLSFVFGMYTSIHPILFPFYFLFVLVFLVKRRVPSFKIGIFSLLLFILPLTPLLLFEYFRHFLEFKTLLSLHGSSSAEIKSFATFIDYGLILFRFPVLLFQLPLSGISAAIFSTLFYASPIVLSIKKIGFWKDRFHIFMIVTTVMAFLGYYYFLPTHVPEYYFIGAESIVFIYAASTLALLYKTKAKLFLIAFLGFVFVVNFSRLVSLWRSSGGYTLEAKEYILREIKSRQKDNPNFAISYNIDVGQEYGLGYLTRLYGIEPRGKPDTVYEIVIPLSRTKETIDILSPSGNIGVVIRH